jgi:hypothetical protein
MPEELKPAVTPATPVVPAAPLTQQEEQEVGDFITRNVLEKDSVFFEG